MHEGASSYLFVGFFKDFTYTLKGTGVFFEDFEFIYSGMYEENYSKKIKPKENYTEKIKPIIKKSVKKFERTIET